MPPSTKHNVELLLEWLQTQLALYTAVRIIPPIPPDFYLDNDVCIDLLVCLAHRFFPSSLPDLIVRLQQRSRSNLRMAQSLFDKHWQLAAASSSDMLGYLCDLYVTATEHQQQADDSGDNEALMTTVLEFVHLKLSSATVLDDDWLGNLERIMMHVSNKAVSSGALQLQHEHLSDWLAQLQTWMTTDDDDAAAAAAAAALKQTLQPSGMLSHAVRQRVMAPACARRVEHAMNERQHKHAQRVAQLQADWHDAHQLAQTDPANAELMAGARLAYARLDGSSNPVPTTIQQQQRTLDDQHARAVQTRERAHQEAEQRRQVDAFLRDSNDVEREAEHVHAAMAAWSWEQAAARVDALKDRISTLTERTAARIPYPKHLNNHAVWQRVHERKAALASAQTSLDAVLQRHRRHLERAERTRLWHCSADTCLAWLDARTHTVHGDAAVILMLDSEERVDRADWVALQHAWQNHVEALAAFRVAKLKPLSQSPVADEKTLAAVDTATATLEHALQLFRQQLDEQLAIIERDERHTKTSATLREHTHAIWAALMPIECGASESAVLPATLFPDPAATTTTTDPAPPTWLADQIKQFSELVEHSHAVQAEYARIQELVNDALSIQAAGLALYLELKQAASTLDTTHPYPAPTATAVQAVVVQANTYCRRHASLDRQHHLQQFRACPSSVRATRPAPFFPPRDGSLYDPVSESCRVLRLVGCALSALLQQYTDACALRDDIESLALRAAACGDAMASVPLADQGAVDDVLDQVELVAASLGQLQARVAAQQQQQQPAVSMQLAADAVEQLRQKADQLTRAVQQHALDAAAREAEAAWQATYLVIHNDDELAASLLPSTLAKLRAQYADMVLAFTEAGKSVQEQASKQQALEARVRERQAQQRQAEHEQRVAAWHVQMDAAFSHVEQLEASIATLVQQSRDTLVPDQAALDTLKAAAIAGDVDVPVPDEPIRASSALVDTRTHALQQRIADMPTSVAHAQQVMDQCSLAQQLVTALDDVLQQQHVDDLEALSQFIDCMAERVRDPMLHVSPRTHDQDDETNARVRALLDSKLDALRERHAALDASRRHREWRSACERIIDTCRDRLTCLENSTSTSTSDDMAALRQAIQGAVDGARARLSDADDLATIQQLENVALEAWQSRATAIELDVQMARDDAQWHGFQARADALGRLHAAYVGNTDGDVLKAPAPVPVLSLQQMDAEVETSCLSVMRAHMAQSSSHSRHLHTMQAQYTEHERRHQALMAAVAAAAAQREHEQQIQRVTHAADALVDEMRQTTHEMQQARAQWTTDRPALEALEQRIHTARAEFAAKVAHVNALGSTGPTASNNSSSSSNDDNGNGSNDVRRQHRMLEETLQEALVFVHKMQGWLRTRDMLARAEAALLHNDDGSDRGTGVCRQLLTGVLAQMDDDDMDARMRYMELFNRVCAVEAEQAARTAEQQRQQQIDTQQQALRRAAERVLEAVDGMCSAMVRVAEQGSTAAIHEHCLATVADVATQRARCERLERELEDVHVSRALHTAVQHMTAMHEALALVGEHARAADEILAWIQVREDRGTVTHAHLKAFAPTMARFRAFKLPTYEPQMQRVALARLAHVEDAWMRVLEWIDDIEASAQHEARRTQCAHQLDEMEALLAGATAQLEQCRRQLLDEHRQPIDAMLREPEALALERRVHALAERTATWLAEHRAAAADVQVDDDALMERQAAVDASAERFYDAVEDTQERVARALAISEYLMLSDDIDLMVSIFKDHVDAAVVAPSKPEQQLASLLQATEAQQKYYTEHIDDKLAAAAQLSAAVDMPPAVDTHFGALCERWAGVQQQAHTRIAMLRQRLQRRGRLASFPTPSTSSPLTPRPGRLLASSLPPRSRALQQQQQQQQQPRYEPDPANALDMEIGRVVNDTQGAAVRVEMVPGEAGKYWFGYRHPRLVYCRILKSGMVMVRVGGGWCELSEFIRERALLEESILCIGNNYSTSNSTSSGSTSTSTSTSKGMPQQGFFSTTARRPSLPHASTSGTVLRKSTSSSTISSSATTNTTASSITTTSTCSQGGGAAAGYLDKYTAVDHLGNHHPVRLVKADNIPSTSGCRTVLMK